jgi:hypothetical protein
MANSLIDDLLRVTSPVPASAGATTLEPASEALRLLTSQINTLQGVYQAQAAQTVENTAAVAQNTRFRAAEAAETAIGVARAAANTLGGGLTLLPLISGVAKLFGFGGSVAEPPPLSQFMLPSAVNLDGGITQRGASPVSSVSYGQNGLPRAVAAPPAPASINVNVQAIDSRSFLDHSDDIAQAVREAMLNSHSLNDVIAEV